MKMSEKINELATALSKAQSEMKGASKDSANPFFKSKYADLASVWEAIRLPFSKNGLAVSQVTTEDEKGLLLTTILMHTSGEWLNGEIRINPVDQKPQTLGSAISYMRRYALSAICGVYAEDDDGNLASGKAMTQSGKTSDPRTEKFQRPPLKYPEPEFDKDDKLPF